MLRCVRIWMNIKKNLLREINLKFSQIDSSHRCENMAVVSEGACRDGRVVCTSLEFTLPSYSYNILPIHKIAL